MRGRKPDGDLLILVVILGGGAYLYFNLPFLFWLIVIPAIVTIVCKIITSIFK